VTGWRELVGAAVLATGLCAATQVRAQAGETRSVLQGVYTEVQADRGERDYGRSCAQCHGFSLEGDAASEVPALGPDAFMRRSSSSWCVRCRLTRRAR
jgi:cytochrome c5